jgi:hypothetical protein
MKTFVSLLHALSVFAAAAPASAVWNPQEFWQQLVGP